MKLSPVTLIIRSVDCSIFVQSKSFQIKAWFPLDRNRIVKSCDLSRIWLIVEGLITLESKNLTEIGLYLQLKRFL